MFRFSFFGFGFQSCCFLSLVFRVSLDVQGHILSFGVQSHHHFLSLTFRAAFPVPGFRAIIIVSQFRRSEPLLLRLTFRVVFSFGVQSHYIVRSDVRSHVLLRLAFRAIIAFQFWRSEPLSLLSFGVQSHHYFQFGIQSLYRFSVWRSEPSALFSFGVQSHHRVYSSTFILIIITF